MSILSRWSTILLPLGMPLCHLGTQALKRGSCQRQQSPTKDEKREKSAEKQTQTSLTVCSGGGSGGGGCGGGWGGGIGVEGRALIDSAPSAGLETFIPS